MSDTKLINTGHSIQLDVIIDRQNVSFSTVCTKAISMRFYMALLSTAFSIRRTFDERYKKSQEI